LIALAFSLPVCMGQTGAPQVPVPPIALSVLSRTELSGLRINRAGWRPVLGEGHFYVQTGAGKYVSVDLDGEIRPGLDIANVPRPSGMGPHDILRIPDMAQDPRGGAIAPLAWYDASSGAVAKAGIARFDDHGNYDSTVWLDTVLYVLHVAKFSSSGNYLVAGYDDHIKFQLSLFDFRGRLLVASVLAGVIDGDSPHVTGAAEEPQTGNAISNATADAAFLQLASGDDDAVYLFKPSWGRRVIRVASSGKCSEIPLPKPWFSAGDSGLPTAMYVSHNSVYLFEGVVSSAQQADVGAGKPTEIKRISISVYDIHDGSLSASFRDDGALGGILVSVAPRQFYFLKAEQQPGGALDFWLVRTGQ